MPIGGLHWVGDWVDKRASVGLRTDLIKINWIGVFLNHFFKLLARSGNKSKRIKTKRKVLCRWFPDKPTSSDMISEQFKYKQLYIRFAIRCSSQTAFVIEGPGTFLLATL